jgi:hypothetical protein
MEQTQADQFMSAGNRLELLFGNFPDIFHGFVQSFKATGRTEVLNRPQSLTRLFSTFTVAYVEHSFNFTPRNTIINLIHLLVSLTTAEKPITESQNIAIKMKIYKERGKCFD